MKKGFTLVELIISIALILIVGVTGIAVFINKKDKTEDKVDEELKEITNVYYQNNFSSGAYKYYRTEEQNTISCLKLSTLIDDGLIPDESTILEEYTDSNTIFKYTVDSEGMSTIEKVEEDDKACQYYTMEQSSFREVDEPGNIEEIVDNNGKKWAATYGYTITDLITENQFAGDIRFNMDLKQIETIETVNPLYVTVILDVSGSMSGTMLTNAKDAITTMLQTFKKMEQKEIYLGAVTYASDAEIVSSFQNISNLPDNPTYTDLNLDVSASGTTNCTAGLTKAKILFTGSDFDGNNDYDVEIPENAVKIALFLSDGVCTNEEDEEIEKAQTLKETGINFFTIAYGSGASTTTLQSIASSSKACDTTNNYTNPAAICYSNATTDNIDTVFENFAVTAIMETIDNPYDKIEFSVELSDYFKFVEKIDSTIQKDRYEYADKTNNSFKKLTRTVKINSCNDEDTTCEETSVLKFGENWKVSDTDTLIGEPFNYQIKFLSDIYKEQNSNVTSNASLKLVKSIQIKMINTSTNEEKIINIPSSDLPTITIDLKNNSVIN